MFNLNYSTGIATCTHTTITVEWDHQDLAAAYGAKKYVNLHRHIAIVLSLQNQGNLIL